MYRMAWPLEAFQQGISMLTGRSKICSTAENKKITAMKSDLSKLFENVIKAFNRQIDDNSKLRFQPEQKLFGEGGALDSLGLVNLITLVEERIEDEYDITVSLADEKAMSRKTSPFLTIGSLMEYVSERLEESLNG